MLVVFKLKRKALNIEEEIRKEMKTNPKDWQNVISLANQADQLEHKIEESEQKIKISSISGGLIDIFQASCLSCLVLRPDLRFRGLFTNKLVQDIDHDFEKTLMELFILISLASHCLRARSFLSGHKQGLLSPGGMFLLLSIALNLLAIVLVMVILGSPSPFLIPAFVGSNGFIVLGLKLLIDKEFRSFPVSSIVIHVLCANLFIITSKRNNLKTCKDSLSEIIFYYTMNMAQLIAAIITFNIYPPFLTEIGKMGLGVSTTTLVHAVLPLCLVTSAAFRALHYMKDAWAFARSRSLRGLQRRLCR